MATASRPCLRALVGDDEAFLAEHWEQRHLLDRGAPGRADDFAALLRSSDLLELVAERGLRSPFFRLVRDGAGLPASGYLRSAGAGHTTVHDLANPGRIAEEIWAGATLVGQALQRTWPPLRDFCAALAGELGHRVQANAYLSPPDAEGFDLHYDTHDVFVLQVEGTKQWSVHAAADHLPHRRRRGAPPPRFGEPVWDGGLEPGDCLYLPRGFGHRARTSGEPSLHLTVGVLALTWRHVLRRLADLLPEQDDALRRALPPGALTDEAPERFDEAWDEFRSLLVERLATFDPTPVRERLQQDVWSAHPPPGAADELARAVRGAVPGPSDAMVLRHGSLERHEWTEAGVVLVRRDRVVRLPAAAAPLVRRLLAGDPVRADDAAHGLDVDSALVVVRRLFREGLLERAAG
ncbi:MAG: hypothetical protein KDB10_12550 [Acidimicrobiales bacterium]|nr:hypothetical protein [Acidimicrobiales bacterium]